MDNSRTNPYNITYIITMLIVIYIGISLISVYFIHFIENSSSWKIIKYTLANWIEFSLLILLLISITYCLILVMKKIINNLNFVKNKLIYIHKITLNILNR